MCCCNTPTVNGEFGYKWQPNDEPSIRQPHPPLLKDGDTVLYDEPGRCGGIDSHCHHFTLIKDGIGRIYLLYMHGSGDGRILLHCYKETLAKSLAALDSTGRYWVLRSLYEAHHDGASDARIIEADRWANAFVEKRIGKRKRRGVVSVFVKPRLVSAAS